MKSSNNTKFSRFTELIATMSIPIAKLGDYKWIYENIEERNPWRKDRTAEIKQLLEDLKLTETSG
jgi:hypothetical protein